MLQESFSTSNSSLPFLYLSSIIEATTIFLKRKVGSLRSTLRAVLELTSTYSCVKRALEPSAALDSAGSSRRLSASVSFVGLPVDFFSVLCWVHERVHYNLLRASEPCCNFSDAPFGHVQAQNYPFFFLTQSLPSTHLFTPLKVPYQTKSPFPV